MLHHRSRPQRILAILVLLSLLFQVEAVFACQLMTSSVPSTHCCCNHAKTTKEHQHQPAGESCCKINAQLTLKEPDLDKELPVIVQAQLPLELPVAVFYWIVAVWPEEAQFGSNIDTNSSYISTHRFNLPGAKTYLATQRLRI